MMTPPAAAPPPTMPTMSPSTHATHATRSGEAYFLYHSIGTYPDKQDQMNTALQQFAANWCANDDGQWGRALGLRQQFIDLWSALIHAESGTLTCTDNVTTALFSLIGALPPHMLKGRRILIAADCFPSLHFLLSGLAERQGPTVSRFKQCRCVLVSTGCATTT